jgi:WD40 repeat protein
VAVAYDSDPIVKVIKEKHVWKKLKGHTNEVLAIQFSRDDTLLATGSKDRMVMVWSMCDGSRQRIFYGASDWVWSVDISPDNKHLVAASREHFSHMWSMETGEVVHTLVEHGATCVANCIKFSLDGQ